MALTKTYIVAVSELLDCCYGCLLIEKVTTDNLVPRVREKEVIKGDEDPFTEVKLCSECDKIMASLFCQLCEKFEQYNIAVGLFNVNRLCDDEPLCEKCLAHEQDLAYRMLPPR